MKSNCRYVVAAGAGRLGYEVQAVVVRIMTSCIATVIIIAGKGHPEQDVLVHVVGAVPLCNFIARFRVALKGPKVQLIQAVLEAVVFGVKADDDAPKISDVVPGLPKLSPQLIDPLIP